MKKQSKSGKYLPFMKITTGESTNFLRVTQQILCQKKYIAVPLRASRHQAAVCVPWCCIRTRLMHRLGPNTGFSRSTHGQLLGNQDHGCDNRHGSTYTQPEGLWQYMFPSEHGKWGNPNTIWNYPPNKITVVLQLELTTVHVKASW